MSRALSGMNRALFSIDGGLFDMNGALQRVLFTPKRPVRTKKALHRVGLFDMNGVSGGHSYRTAPPSF